MDSIIQSGKYCFLCGSTENLDSHHIFHGASRSKSEQYGLKVWLCHTRCHIYGQKAVHNCIETDNRLKKIGQEKAMEYYGWSIEDFRQIFGKNYL